MLDILKDWRITRLGLFSWALPFVLSFAFFDQTGELSIPRPLFKSLMVVAGGGIGVVLLVMAFRRVEPSLSSGVLIGCYWLALNLVLDLIVLVPMSGMNITDYFSEIGLRYALLPMISAGMGMVAGQKA